MKEIISVLDKFKSIQLSLPIILSVLIISISLFNNYLLDQLDLTSAYAASYNVLENPRTGSAQLLIGLKWGINVKDNNEESVKSLVSEYTKVNKVRKEFKEASKNNKLKDRLDGIFSVEVGGVQSLSEVITKIRANPLVESVQFNYLYEPDLIPSDPRYTEQWAHPKTQAPQAWDVATGDPGVAIAAIGTGVKWDHEDLVENIWQNSDEKDGNGLDDDANGYIDDVRGWNFESSTNNPSDSDGHETSVAGSAAARGNNGKGVAGVCWQCKIMPLRVSYNTLSVADAIYYAVNNGARVINMSFGNYDVTKYGPDTIVEDAVNYAVSNNVLVIATAGNDSITTKRYPGALENVIGVSATDSNDNRAGFSNYGDWVDVAAPGASILATTLSGYGSVNGTSFSAPYVAGLAGLLYSKYPSITVAETRRNIEYSVDKIVTDQFIGSGRVNVNRSLTTFSPSLFAVIKGPKNNQLISQSGLLEIWGTALGDSYILEYRGTGSSSWIQFYSGLETINGTLGQLDVSGLPSIFDIRLVASKNSSQDTSIVSVAKAGPYQVGWPKSISSPILSAPNVYDVDGNGDLEVVVGVNGGAVYILNHDGTFLPGWPQAVGTSYVYGSPTIGDIDGDGDVEIVASTYGASGVAYIRAWHHNGSTVLGWPKLTGQIRGSVLLINLDGDPALEIISAYNQSGVAKVYAWNGDGSLVTGWPYTISETNVQTSPAGGDIDGDGLNDVVVCSWNYCWTLDRSGNLISQWTKTGSSHTSPVLADIDGNGVMDIVLAEGFAVKIRDYQGNVIKSMTMSSDVSYGQLSVGDINHDGKKEIFISSDTSPYKVYGWDYNGLTLSGWPKSLNNSGETPTIGDINNDHVEDVVVATKEGRIYAWSYSGSLLPDFPQSTGSVLYRAAGITDLDKDGDIEIIAGGEDGMMHVWDFPSLYNGNYLAWPFGRHDQANTAYLPYSPTPPDLINPTVSITSPSDGDQVTGTISINANASDNVSVSKVEFYVDGILKGTDTTAPYSYSWNTSGLAPSSSHALQAKAYDGTGNTSVSTVTVTIMDNDTISPTVTITFPANGGTVIRRAKVVITASASDNVSVSRVEFFVGNVLKCTDATSPYNCSWSVPNQKNNYGIRADAYDAAGNKGTHTISVTAK